MTDPMAGPLVLTVALIIGVLGLIVGMALGHTQARLRPRRPVGRVWVSDSRRLR